MCFQHIVFMRAYRRMQGTAQDFEEQVMRRFEAEAKSQAAAAAAAGDGAGSSSSMEWMTSDVVLALMAEDVNVRRKREQLQARLQSLGHIRKVLAKY